MKNNNSSKWISIPKLGFMQSNSKKAPAFWWGAKKN